MMGEYKLIPEMKFVDEWLTHFGYENSSSQNPFEFLMEKHKAYIAETNDRRKAIMESFIPGAENFSTKLGEKHNGFMPLVNATFLWRPIRDTINEDRYKVMFKPITEQQAAHGVLEKYITRSGFWSNSYGSENEGWEKVSPQAALSQFWMRFFEDNRDTVEGSFNIPDTAMYCFLKEVGKIYEFEDIRKMRFVLRPEGFETFQEYEKEIWCYDYCHPVLH